MPPDRSSTPSLSLIGYAFERAGLHPGVRVTIESAAWLGDALAVELRVFYAAGLQICCAELGCYMSAFSTRGLTAVARHIQAEELLDATPRLRVVATLELADGFTFSQPGLGAASGARLVYDSPEAVGPDA